MLLEEKPEMKPKLLILLEEGNIGCTKALLELKQTGFFDHAIVCDRICSISFAIYS